MNIADSLSRNIAFPFWAWKDGSDVQKNLEEAERHQYLAPDELEALQLRRLRQVLEHAQRHVPYYTRLFREHDIAAQEVRTWADYEKLPVLTRTDLQQAGDDLRSRVLPGYDRFVEGFSGGTSGQPAHFFVSASRMEYRRASTLRHDRWAGWEIGQTRALLWSAPRDLSMKGWKAKLRNAVLERNLILDASQVTRETLLEFVSQLRSRRPRTWLAYGGALSLVMRFLEENGIDDIQADAVINSAELLRPGERERVRRVLGCEVYDRYGCREVSIIASECGHSPGHGLHVNADCIKVEFEPIDATGRGHLLLTDLMNLATPFIRYRIGDIGRPQPGICPCGRGLPMMAPVEGRSTDFIVAADGRLVSGVTLTVTVLADLRAVHKVQIVQERRGEVLVRYVPLEGATGAEREILALCKEWLGTDTKVEFEIVEDIPLSASGKTPLSVSTVDPFEVLG